MMQKHPLLFTSYQLGNIQLSNRIVMAPMTRSRAIGSIPNELLTTYYGQRATAGLIITEGTSPSPNGLGYARIPGLFNQEQVDAWKLVTDEVHAKGGHIFVQLMHTGRITHMLNLPYGGKVVAPSAIAAANTPMWTDTQGMQPLPVPEEIATEELPLVIAEFVQSAKNAVAAGFDGIELHGANGYLLEQFLNPASNLRTDNYGGSVENRNRFVLEVAQAAANAIGKERVGIRLSPFGVNGEMISDDTTEAQYALLATRLKEIGLVYIHMVNHADLGAPPVPVSVEQAVRKAFGSTIIISGGYDANSAEADLQAGEGELVAFGRPFISNPDLVNRFELGLPLSNALDVNTFYTPGEKGYTDYPPVAVSAVSA